MQIRPKKIGPDNRIFTYKYVVGKQRIRLHILIQETEDIDPVDILDFLNHLQKNYDYHSNWNRFYFNCFNLPDQNIKIFKFFGSESIFRWRYERLVLVQNSYLHKSKD